MSVTLHQGDCLEFLKTLDPSTVDAVITDPPYGMGWDTDSTRYTGSKWPGRGRADWGVVRGDAEPFDPSPWLGFARVVLWGANHYAGRLPVGTTLVWVKKHEESFGTFLSDAEVGWMKGGHGVYCYARPASNQTKRTEGGGVSLHPTQKPIGLMVWCIDKLKLAPGMTVLDPYMGSGTTGVACVKAGLNFIGCEIDPKHFATAERRIEEARPTLFAAFDFGEGD